MPRTGTPLAMGEANGAPMEMQTAIADSLLDEATFMAELGDLTAGLVSLKQSPQSFEIPLEAAVVLPTKASARNLDSFDWPAPIESPGMFADDEGPARQMIDGVGNELVQGPSLLWRVTAAAMFVMMMGVGAAGAALVFHERVARIVATWQM